MRLILLLLLLFSSPAYADFKDWTPQNQRLYMSAVTLHTMDVMQTFVMIECQERNPHCPYIEKNPFLGKHPSKGRVVLSMGIAQLLYYRMLDNDRLSSRQRRNLLILNNTLAIYPVWNNEQVGLGFYIPIIPYRNFIKK